MLRVDRVEVFLTLINTAISSAARAMARARLTRAALSVRQTGRLPPLFYDLRYEITVRT